MSDHKIDEALLAKGWLHSHEDDTADTTVYRPSTETFPPSRGRKGFTLQANGVLSTRQPGPTDQTVTGDGTWKLVGQTLELHPDGQKPQRLPIVSVAANRLVVRKVPAVPQE